MKGIRYFKNFIFFSLIACLANSCQSSENKALTNEANEINNTLTRLNQTWNNQSFEFDQISLDSEKHTKSLLVYLDAGCSVCFAKLKTWKAEIIPTLEGKVDLLFLLKTENPIISEIHLEAINFDASKVVFLESNKFEEKYPFMINSYSNAMLLDENLKIQYIGSPKFSPLIKEVILDLLSSDD